MHSSYALSSDDFKVERGGKPVKRLADLWPGGYQPGDRLGVVLAQPMDAVGCSNLICATITMFYDLLREQHGTGNFFRYCDTYLFGVGCEAGDFNQLDIWPLHKLVTILQPTTEALLEARQRPQGQPAGDPRDRRPLPRRGGALDLECVPGPRQDRRHLLAAHRACARRGRRPGRQQGGRELRRAGDLHDSRHRRRLPGEAAPAAAQPRPRREAAGRGVPDAAQPGRRAGAAGRDPGAAARPPGADPARDADHDPAGRGADAAGRRRLGPF